MHVCLCKNVYIYVQVFRTLVFVEHAILSGVVVV